MILVLGIIAPLAFGGSLLSRDWVFAFIWAIITIFCWDVLASG